MFSRGGFCNWFNEIPSNIIYQGFTTSGNTISITFVTELVEFVIKIRPDYFWILINRNWSSWLWIFWTAIINPYECTEWSLQRRCQFRQCLLSCICNMLCWVQDVWRYSDYLLSSFSCWFLLVPSGKQWLLICTKSCIFVKKYKDRIKG